MDRAKHSYKSGLHGRNSMNVGGQIRKSLKRKQAMVEFPMTIGTKRYKVIQGVHNGDSCVFREILDRPAMANFNVF